MLLRSAAPAVEPLGTGARSSTERGTSWNSIGCTLPQSPVPTNAELDAWFAALEHPLKPAMQRVRHALLADADQAMADQVQYGTVTTVRGAAADHRRLAGLQGRAG